MRGRLAACLALGAWLVFLAADVEAQSPSPPPQDPVAGSRVFGAKGCGRCHAIQGVGGKDGPDLARSARSRSFGDLAAALWNHAPRMAQRMRELDIPRPGLDARESADLVAFLFTASYFDPPGKPDAGRKLFTEKRCVVCHQVAGVGGVVGPDLTGFQGQATPISLAAAMWSHGPQMAEVMRAKRIARPTFTGTELRDLIAYLGPSRGTATDERLYVLPGNPEVGRGLFATKQCAGCHGVRASGARRAPDLADRRRGGSPIEFAAAMWNKAPSMMAAMQTAGIPPPPLRPDEMADILAYLYSMRYMGPAGDPRKGLALATGKGCLGCHGIGRPGKTAGDLTVARGVDTPGGALSALWSHSFIGDPEARVRGAFVEMTGDEMTDLMAYLHASRRGR
jgi:mono/diheme cytochrome c family protein